MSGYTPLFASLTTGTLCGRWPDVGLWPIVLSLADRHGVVDVTNDYIARVSGLAIEDVTACMRRFCEPDPFSRSSGEGGARLVLFDPDNRSWGWRVVNHAKYREKARKTAYDAARTESGADAARKREERKAPDDVAPNFPDVSRDLPTCPANSRDIPLSDKTKQNNKYSRPQQRPLEASDFHQEVISAYHELLPDLPRVKVWSKKRARALDARIRERCAEGKEAGLIKYWRSLFQKIAASDFLCGRSRNWRAGIDWLINEGNFAKIIEGNYDSRDNGHGVDHA